MTPLTNIAQRQWLKDLRTARSLYQRQIAAHASISAQQYSAIERGLRNPSTAVAKKIANLLGFSWTRFYDDIE